jgi:hypothetical protein
VGSLKPPSFASFDNEFNSYDWSVPLDGFMSTPWLVHGQSTINTLEIHSKFKIYSKKVFLLEPNYHKLCSSSKNEFLILYKVDLAEPKIQLLPGTPTLIPKVLQVFSIKTASKQPLSKARWIVQSLNNIWYF